MAVSEQWYQWYDNNVKSKLWTAYEKLYVKWFVWVEGLKVTFVWSQVNGLENKGKWLEGLYECVILV